MRAAFLAVGSELLGTDRVDTNSLHVTEVLARFGVEMTHKAVVGDSVANIARELTARLEQEDLIIISGGLGPTADDVTREAVATALKRGTYEEPSIVAGIEEKFQRMGWTMPEVNRRQGQVIEGAEILVNPLGTAPGLKLVENGGTLLLLPGVPRELKGLVETYLVPWLESHTAGEMRETWVLKVACLPESELEERISPAYEEFGRESITVLSKPAEITLRLTATGSRAQREDLLSRMGDRLKELVGDAVYSERDEPLEAVVGELLRSRGWTVGTAESCTGGLVAERLTRVGGSSDYFEGSVVTYSNRLKEQQLAVDGKALKIHGSVSEPVARAMAVGARAALATDFAISITGVAGPGGGSEDKPVGTVHLAIADPQGEVVHRRVLLPGNRQRIRWQSSQIALDMLRRRLMVL